MAAASYLFIFQEKASELLKVYRSSGLAGRSVLSFQELCTLSSDVCADESTLCIVLLQLQRDKQVTVSLHDGEKVNKVSFIKTLAVRLASYRSLQSLITDIFWLLVYC